MKHLELHIIQSVPVACLNRDDLNSPKTAIFGGVQRARVSSQSWKRAIREMAKEIMPEQFKGERTRLMFEPLVKEMLSAGLSMQLNLRNYLKQSTLNSLKPGVLKPSTRRLFLTLDLKYSLRGWWLMSSDNTFLALRLEGPLQSWGFDSQYNRRNTGLMPTKSAIAGMCCAALGYHRGSNEEHGVLASFGKIKMTAIAIPRNGVKKELPVRRLQDYHTVQKTRRASGAINNDCVLTHRQYLTDAAFGVLLEGDGILLSKIEAALADPVWGLWLGRKTCIPTAPVLAGLKENRGDALRLLIGEQSLESFTRQEDVENFADGRDSLPDAPVSFATERRLFSPRRVQTRQCKSPLAPLS